MKRLVQDLDFEFKRQRKEIIEGSQTIQSNLEHISQLQAKLETRPKSLDNNNHRLSPYGKSSPHNMNENEQITAMKQEKDQLNHKLDEFG